MNNFIQVIIPEHMKHPFFFDQMQYVTVDPALYQDWNIEGVRNFHFELLFNQTQSCYQPWLHSEEVVPALYKQSKTIMQELDELYKERNIKEAAPKMREIISICFACQFWQNDKPVILNSWEKAVNECIFKPVNFIERMNFILSRPTLYQSYKAIEQIMIELEKLYARIVIKKQLNERQKNV
jgi:hypothetical protein